MTKQEMFVEKTYEIVSELKLPLIDNKIKDRFKFKMNNLIMLVKFVFRNDESIIRGFLGLAVYFHSVIIRRKERFYILHGQKMFILECG